MRARDEHAGQRLHPAWCRCDRCDPDRVLRRMWTGTGILAFGGSLAMLIDASGYTPALARLLGMIP